MTFICHHARDWRERTEYIYLGDFFLKNGLMPICHARDEKKPCPQNGGAYRRTDLF